MGATHSGPVPRLNKQHLFADLGYKPHAGQLEVHLSNAPRRVLACGVRWGKSTCAAMEAIAAAMEPRERSLGWIVGPTFEISNQVFRHVHEILQSKLSHRVEDVSPRDHRLVLRNLGGGVSELRAKSADHAVSLLGEGLDWLILDEAARVKESIWEAHLSQRLIDRNGWAFLISTPRGKGWFYKQYRLGQGKDPDYESWNRATWTNPLLDQDVIERERGRLSEQMIRLGLRLPSRRKPAGLGINASQN